MKEDRVILAGVGAPHENHVGFFNLIVGARAPTRTEDRRQTDDARSVSRSITAVDVVGAESHTCQLLGQEVDFVAGLGAAERAYRVPTVERLDPLEALRGAVQRFFPRRLAKAAVF